MLQYRNGRQRRNFKNNEFWRCKIEMVDNVAFLNRNDRQRRCFKNSEVWRCNIERADNVSF